jgi:hypothetical protein
MKGYKAFNNDWTCANNFQYEIGKKYQIDDDQIVMCQAGFHFCRVPVSILDYYRANDNKYAEIKASGKILEEEDKCVCSQIEIIKELSYQEVKELSTGLFIRNDGSKLFYLKGHLHRLDGPAIEFVDGTREWWIEGKKHREDGPAIERPNGTKCWYINNKKHREDGPAYEGGDGTKEWFFNGLRYRTDHLFNGLRYRRDGPSIEPSN